MRTLVLAGLVAAFISGACEGPAGPAGPMGPPGERGPEGPRGVPGVPGTGVATFFFSGNASPRSEVYLVLPRGAGTFHRPPEVTCYIAFAERGPYFAISTDSETGTMCGVLLHEDGELYAFVAPPFGTDRWYYQLVVRPQAET